jgi:hypothetical protein
MSKKVYKVKIERCGFNGCRERIVEGTLEELIKYFQYTLEVGASYNKSIKTKPKTIKSLLSNLDKAYDVKEGIRKTYVSLV